MKLTALILVLFCALACFAQQAEPELLPVKVNSKWGYMYPDGDIAIEPVYDLAESFDGNLFAKVQYLGKPCLVNKKGILMQLPLSSNVKVFKDSLLLVENNGMQGLARIDFSPVLPVEYDVISAFTNFAGYSFRDAPKLVLLGKDSLWGVADYEGTILVPVKFTGIDFTGRIFIVADTTGYGAYTLGGKEILPTVFENVRAFYQSHVMALQNGLWGIYDTTGNLVVPHHWKSTYTLNNCYVVVHNEDSVIAVNVCSGTSVDISSYDQYFSYYPYCLKVSKEGKYGLFDASGLHALPARFDDFYKTAGYYYVINDAKTGLYDSNGRQIAAPQYDFIDVVQGNTALVANNEKWGMLNMQGQEIIPLKYNDIDVAENTAKARIGNTIDIYELTAAGRVSDITSFDDVITLRVNGGSTMQNIRSTFNLTTRNSRFAPRGSWFYDTAIHKWGLKDKEGKVLLPPAFDDVIRTDSSKFAIVVMDAKAYTMRLFGAEVLFTNKRGLVRESDGKIILKPAMAFIDGAVLNSRFSAARVLTASGNFMTVTERGVFPCNNCRFMDEQHDGFHRVYIGRVDSKRTIAQDSNHLYLENEITQLGGRLISSRRSKAGYTLDFKNGYWTYIKPNGQRGMERYQWAGNFHHRRAIVKAERLGYCIVDADLAFKTTGHDSLAYLPFSEKKNFIVISRSNKYGFIDTLGDPVTGFNYERTGEYSPEGYAWVMKYEDPVKKIGEEYRYINMEGNDAHGNKYNMAADYKNGYAAVKTGNKWYFKDVAAYPVNSEGYTKVGTFNNGLAWVKMREGYNFINTIGQPLTTEYFARVTGFFYGKAAVVPKKGDKWYFIDTDGSRTGNKVYNYTEQYDSLGYCVVATKKKKGLIDKSENIIVPEKYNRIEGPANGIYLLLRKNKYYMLDINQSEMKLRKIGKYSYIHLLPNGNAVGIRDGKTYIIKQSEETLLCDKTVSHKNIHPNFIIAGFGRYMGVLNYDGDTLIPFDYTALKYLGEGLFSYRKKNNGIAVLNIEGIELIRNLSSVMSFNNGLAAAQKNNKWGVINTNGLWVCAPKYDWIGSYTSPLAKAQLSITKNILNLDGTVLLNADFEKLEYEPYAKLYRIEQGNRLGYINLSGQWVWPLSK